MLAAGIAFFILGVSVLIELRTVLGVLRQVRDELISCRCALEEMTASLHVVESKD
jgi:hypothetical protein